MKTTIESKSAGTSLLLALMVLIGSAHAQPSERLARIGFLSLSKPPGVEQGISEALRGLGYIAGTNVHYEFRYANWQSERLPELAGELVRQKVDVIVALTNIPAFAAKKTTEQIPIVVWASHGAVQTGLVRSLPRPGGNVTGIESLAPELDTKRLELIKEILPKLTRLGVVFNPEDQGSQVHLESIREAAQRLGVRLVPLPAKRPDDFKVVLSDAAAASIDALLTFTDDLTAWNWYQIAEFASKHQLPTVCEFRSLVQAGCLLSYGPLFAEFNMGVARQIDKILKGARVSELPVDQVTRFETLLNMKTANALGITFPRSLRMRADEVLE